MKIFPNLLLRNWWVIIFLIMSWAIFIQVIHKKNRVVHTLNKRVQNLENACAKAESEKISLMLRKQSKDDPNSIELVLKEKLGVVPEGQIKVIFK